VKKNFLFSKKVGPGRKSLNIKYLSKLQLEVRTNCLPFFFNALMLMELFTVRNYRVNPQRMRLS